MVRSLKERLERLQEYASKTEYATTDECISLYVDCLRFAFQQDEIKIDIMYSQFIWKILNDESKNKTSVHSSILNRYKVDGLVNQLDSRILM